MFEENFKNMLLNMMKLLDVELEVEGLPCPPHPKQWYEAEHGQDVYWLRDVISDAVVAYRVSSPIKYIQLSYVPFYLNAQYSQFLRDWLDVNAEVGKAVMERVVYWLSMCAWADELGLEYDLDLELRDYTKEETP